MPEPDLKPSADPGAGLQILSMEGFLTQEVGGRISLRLAAARQWTLSGRNPFSSVAEFQLMENPSYDRFSWNGDRLDARLSALLLLDIQLVMGHTSGRQSFPGIESRDLEGRTLGIPRSDRRSIWQIRLEKHFSRFSLLIGWTRIRNLSSDPLFQWSGDQLTAGIEWTLFFGGGK